MNLARKPTQEPFYAVTEAEETPLMEADFLETPAEAVIQEAVGNSSKKKVQRNVSEPAIGLQVGRTCCYRR